MYIHAYVLMYNFIPQVHHSLASWAKPNKTNEEMNTWRHRVQKYCNNLDWEMPKRPLAVVWKLYIICSSRSLINLFSSFVLETLWTEVKNGSLLNFCAFTKCKFLCPSHKLQHLSHFVSIEFVTRFMQIISINWEEICLSFVQRKSVAEKRQERR